MKLIDYVLKSNFTMPIQLEIGLDKLANQYSPTGNQSRYMRVKIQGKDVTEMVADMINLKISHAKDTDGCLIIHGCGMDMAYNIQYNVYKQAYILGFPEMFDECNYKYLGKKTKGSYPFS